MIKPGSVDRVAHLPLLSLLLGTMPECVRLLQRQRFAYCRANLEFAAWMNLTGWADVQRSLWKRGLTCWVQEGQACLWCYGAGQIEEDELFAFCRLLWESGEYGQKLRLLLHRRDRPHQLLVISKRDFFHTEERRMAQ